MFLNLRNILLILLLLHLQLLSYIIDLFILQYYQLLKQHIFQDIFSDLKIEYGIVNIKLIGKIRIS